MASSSPAAAPRDEIACPACAERILAGAKVCRFCNRDVERFLDDREEAPAARRSSERLSKVGGTAAQRLARGPSGRGNLIRWLAAAVWFNVLWVIFGSLTGVDRSVIAATSLLAVLLSTILYWLVVLSVASLLDRAPA